MPGDGDWPEDWPENRAGDWAAPADRPDDRSADRAEDPPENRVTYINALYGGPQPSADFSAQPSSVPGVEILPGESRTMPRRFAAMSQKPPPGMAELVVSPQEPTDQGLPRFAVQGTCHCSPVVDLGVYEKPDLELGTSLALHGPTPASFLDEMDTWSFTVDVLRKWLNQHRHKHRGQLELVIRDVTRCSIPWELLRLPFWEECGLPAGYLGAVLTVTRFLPLHPQQPEFAASRDSSAPAPGTGLVVAHIDDDMGHDRNLLRGFRVEPADDSVQQLFRKLAGRGEPADIVYVACYAEFGDTPYNNVLGGFTFGRATRSNDVLPRVRMRPAEVFLNGCRMGADDLDVRQYNDLALGGFAILFLQAGAAGVLANAGAVGAGGAGELAEALFTQLRAKRGLSVTQAVRLLRADAAKKIAELLDGDTEDDGGSDGDHQENDGHQEDDDSGDEVSDDTLRPLLYPFLHVCYSSPRLLKSNAAGGGSGGTREQGPAGSGEA
jgi:hypothetical protein